MKWEWSLFSEGQMDFKENEMKRIKLPALITTLLVTGGLLTACGFMNGSSPSTSETSVLKEEVVSGASISDRATVIKKALGNNGNWIVAITDDVIMKDVIVSGKFHKKGDDSQDIYRKLALYAQDDSNNVTDEYTLEVPLMIIKTENFNIVHGTLKGDIIVKANGFILDGTKLYGNIVFEKEEYKNSAILDEAEVTGQISVLD